MSKVVCGHISQFLLYLHNSFICSNPYFYTKYAQEVYNTTGLQKLMMLSGCSMFYQGHTKKSTQSSILVLVFSFIAEMAVTKLLKTENTRLLPLDLTHCKIPMNGGILTTNLSQANI